MRKLLAALAILLAALTVAGAALYEPDRDVETLFEHWGLPASRFVQIEGMRVHVAVQGRGPPLVLLHGTGASLHTWDGWAAALAEEFLIVRPDLPGYGLTGPHPRHDYSMSAYARFLDGLTAEFGLGSFHLAGNSLGGRIAWHYAATRPERVRRLILIDASGYPRDRNRPLVFRLARIPMLSGVLTRMTPRSLFRRSLEEVYADDALVDEQLVQRYFELSLRTGNREAFVRRARAEHDRAADPSALLGDIRAPTLIQWGRRDVWIPVADGERFARAIADARLIVYPTLGHVPMEESPQLTAGDARRFLLDE